MLLLPLLACGGPDEPDPYAPGGGGGGDYTGGDPTPEDTGLESGEGFHATGELDGTAFTTRCGNADEWTRTYGSGVGYGDQFTMTCAGDTVQVTVSLNVADPIGTHSHGEEDKSVRVSLGLPGENPLLEIGSDNLEAASITTVVWDTTTNHWAGGFAASWANEGDHHGDVSGAFDVYLD